MSPMDWAMRPLKRYAQFSGRAPRAEFWWFFLAVLVLYFVLSFVIGAVVGGMAATQTEPSAGLIGMFGAAGIFIVVFWLALLIPTIAVQLRRLHDTNRSGWWLFVFYILYVVYMFFVFGTLLRIGSAADPSQVGMGSVAGVGVLATVMMIYSIVLIVFFCLPGTKGPNKYGDDPYGGDLGEVFA